MASVKYRNPLYLSNLPISLHKVPFGGEVAAHVVADLSKKAHRDYVIEIFEEKSHQLWYQSIYHKIGILYHVWEIGVLDHELAHIISGTMDAPDPIHDWIYERVANIMDDTSDEYRFMMRYPEQAKFVQLVLSCLKYNTPDEIKDTVLANDLSTLYFLVRFGVIKQGADPKFASFALSMLLTSNRGTHKNTVQASKAIYEYLHTKHVDQGGKESKRTWSAASMLRGSSQEVLSQQDIETILQGFAVQPTGVLGTLKDVLAQQAMGFHPGSQGQQQKLSGTLAGLDGPPPDDDEKSDDFFLQTCGMYPTVITELEHIWLRNKAKISPILSFEGNLPISHHQKRAALKALRAGEETRSYRAIKREKPSDDVLIFLDVSSSIGSAATSYARSLVCFLASLDNKPGVRVGLVFFNSDYKVIMRFGEKISKAKVYPQASGGTVLYPALVKTKDWYWEAKNRYCIIITDGDIAGWYDECLPELERRRANQDIQSVLIEITYDESQALVSGEAGESLPGSFASTIESLPYKLMNWITSVQGY